MSKTQAAKQQLTAQPAGFANGVRGNETVTMLLFFFIFKTINLCYNSNVFIYSGGQR